MARSLPLGPVKLPLLLIAFAGAVALTVLVYLILTGGEDDAGPRLSQEEVLSLVLQNLEHTGPGVTSCSVRAYDEGTRSWTVDCQDPASSTAFETVWVVDDRSETAIRVTDG